MKRGTFIILISIVLIFIWGHSLMPVETSSTESVEIMYPIQDGLDYLNIPVTLTEPIVRKFAHFTEHAAAGLLLGLFVYPRLGYSSSRRDRAEAVAIPMLAGFFIGFIDETIQIFTGRGPLVQDVWIDFAGVFCGVGIAILICGIRHRRKNKRGKKGKE
ncbi:MAG: VanZ family protein [Ruminiclostridium sp.]|nr:VanZ family protein [Ruminiclostridium sp.]